MIVLKIANHVLWIFLQILIDVHFFSFSPHSTSKKETFEPFWTKIPIGEPCQNQDRNMVLKMCNFGWFCKNWLQNWKNSTLISWEQISFLLPMNLGHFRAVSILVSRCPMAIKLTEPYLLNILNRFNTKKWYPKFFCLHCSRSAALERVKLRQYAKRVEIGKLWKMEKRRKRVK